MSSVKFHPHYGFGVDTGTGCFADAAAAGRLTSGENTVPDDDSSAGILVLDDSESGGNLIVYPSRTGDASYPPWIGPDADGQLTCLVADMLILRHHDLLPNRSQQVACGSRQRYWQTPPKPGFQSPRKMTVSLCLPPSYPASS
ncbi:hypothetical protein ACIBJF_45575 [Streptomyces sp. NPDC050743]|uniref:hypothetical protein n=1 Tax=Streptomyces sp. NPDC050743 TaxID=3365634 RepID=UPI00378C1506